MRKKITNRQKEFLFLNIYILTQHSRFQEAFALVNSMRVLGEECRETLLANTILLFLLEHYEQALDGLRELDAVDPLEQFGSYVLTGEQSMRRYIRARCLYMLHDEDVAKDAIDIYLGKRRAQIKLSRDS